MKLGPIPLLYVYIKLMTSNCLQVIDGETNNTITNYTLEFTDLRKNEVYLWYYSLLGSFIVVLFVPFLILVTTYIKLCRSIPRGSTRNQMINIVLIIILMFIICHLSTVILPVYEILSFGMDSEESMTSRPKILIACNEINTLLLVIYFSMNPFAYCGKSIVHEMKNFFLQWCKTDRYWLVKSQKSKTFCINPYFCFLKICTVILIKSYPAYYIRDWVKSKIALRLK